jgi:hypothetical protein
MREMEISVKIRFSDPVRDKRHVTKLVFGALLDQLGSVGLAPTNEDAYTERITVESVGIRHVWDIDSDPQPLAPRGPLSFIQRGIARISNDDLNIEQNRQAIDAVLETLTTGRVSRADVVTICIAILESVCGVKNEPSFNQELHDYALNRLCEYEAREPSGAVAAVLAS